MRRVTAVPGGPRSRQDFHDPGRNRAGMRARAGRTSAGRGRLTRMRPAIKAGLLMVWRDPDTLQIGIDPRRAVALRGMRGAEALINLLDGSRDLGQVLAAAQDQGISRHAAERVIGLLAAAGALHDFPAATLRALPDGLRARLAGELATVSLALGHADGGALVLARRQGAYVRVHGTGPVASSLASLLTASGIGRVSCTGMVGGPPAGGPRGGGLATRGPGPARPPGCGRASRAAPGRAGTRASAGPGRPGRRLPAGVTGHPGGRQRRPPDRGGQRSHRRGRPAGRPGPDGLPGLRGHGPHRP